MVGVLRCNSLFGAFVVITLWAAVASSGMKVNGIGNYGRAPEFELKDQYDKTYSYRFPKTRITILTLGDRKGSEQIEPWVRPVYQRYQERVEHYGIAVLNTVPSLMRGVVRGIFKNKVKYSVLLDWKGEVAKSLKYESKQANVFVVNRTGQIVYRTKGPATSTALNNLYREVDRLLAEAGQ